MKNIGLVGEDPNDTSSIRNLLIREHKYRNLHFLTLGSRIRGHQLENPKTQRIIDFETVSKKVELIIFIRDLDTRETNTQQIQKRYRWFTWLNTKNIGVLLLNIFELEALIIADIDTFNSIFKTKIKFTGDPMGLANPKEFLIERTYKNHRVYCERDAPAIFNHLNISIIKKRCRYFNKFIGEFELRVSKGKANG